MAEIDIVIFFNQLLSLHWLFNYLALGITHFGIPLLMIVVLATKNKRLIINSIIALLLASVLEIGIGFSFFRPRPFIGNDINLILHPYTDSSFPSGHTTRAFVLALMLARYYKKPGIFALALALLVAMSRIILGVHYATDILGGIVVSIVSVLIVEWTCKYFKR